MNLFKKIGIRALLLSVFVLSSKEVHAASDTLVWSSPVNVSNTGHPVSSPQIVNDGVGNAVVVWVDQTTGYVRSSFSPAGVDTWTSPTNIATGSLPVFPPAIAMNASGHGVIVYDNGASVSGSANRLSYKLFTVSAGVFSLNGSAIDCNDANSGPPLVAIDSQKNITVLTLVKTLGLTIYTISAPGTSWGTYIQLDGTVNGRIDGYYSPYALAVNSSRVGFSIDSNDGSPPGAYSWLISAGQTSSTVYSPVYTGNGVPAILAGIDEYGDRVSVANTTSPTSWQIFFSPSGISAWTSSLSLTNINATIANPPTLNVNANGLGVLAYNLTTDNNVHGRFIHTPNQTVGRDFVIGQGINPDVDTDEFGDAFATWINPQGYVSGAWLPVGSSAWASSSQISLLPISSGTVPAITTLNLAAGAIVYAAGNDIRCVFYQLANPDVIKHGALINTLKYNNDRRQKGIQ